MDTIILKMIMGAATLTMVVCILLLLLLLYQHVGLWALLVIPVLGICYFVGSAITGEM